METEITYRFRPGSRHKIDAAVAAAELEKIAGDGPIHADLVVKSARRKKSPLHNLFEWDDKEAAGRYRLNQAHNLIGNIEVVVQSDPEKEPICVRAFVANSTGNSRREGYVRVQVALATDDPDLLERALDEIKAWKKRYANLRELKPVFEAIERI